MPAHYCVSDQPSGDAERVADRMKTMLVGLGAVVVGAIALGCVHGATMVRQGTELFVAEGCHGCHTVGSRGTPIGPDLSHVGARYDNEYLVRWLTDPTSVRPAAHMPQLELSETQIRALAAYLSSLH